MRCPDCDAPLVDTPQGHDDYLSGIRYGCPQCRLILTEADLEAMPMPTYERLNTPYLCENCGELLVWNETESAWVCPDSPAAHATSEPCDLCGHRGHHDDGCPNGPAPKIQCSHCGDVVKLSEAASHMQEAHGVETVDQDQIEQSFVQAREHFKRVFEGMQKIRPDGPFDPDDIGDAEIFQSEMDFMEVWAAMGYRAICGEWPPDFAFGAAIVSCLHEADRLRREQHRAVDRIRELEQAMQGMTEESERRRRIENEVVDLLDAQRTDPDSVGVKLDALRLLVEGREDA